MRIIALAALAAACIVTLLRAEAIAAHPRPFPGWWLQQALCVHRGEGSWLANTGNGFEGGMQFLNSTWLSNGGGRYARHAYQATPHEQLHVAFNLWRRAGWQPWPTTARACGLL